MTCAPHIRATTGSTPPRPTRVRLAAAARGGGKAELATRPVLRPPRTLRRSAPSPACTCQPQID